MCKDFVGKINWWNEDRTSVKFFEPYPYPSIPRMAKFLIEGLHVVEVGETLTYRLFTDTFTDRLGQTVAITRTLTGLKPVVDNGYAKFVWDFLNGNIRVSKKDGRQLYIRESGIGQQKGLCPWRPLYDIVSEYAIQDQDPSADWYGFVANECYLRNLFYLQGIRFGSTVFIRESNTEPPRSDGAWLSSKVTRYTLSQEELNSGALAAFAMESAYDPDKDKAQGILRTVNTLLGELVLTEEDKQNLIRAFAAPFLCPSESPRVYLLTGCGQDGRDLILNLLRDRFKEACPNIDSDSVLQSFAEINKLRTCRWWVFPEWSCTDSRVAKLASRFAVNGSVARDSYGEFFTNLVFLVMSNSAKVADYKAYDDVDTVCVRFPENVGKSTISRFNSILHGSNAVHVIMYMSALLWEEDYDNWKSDNHFGAYSSENTRMEMSDYAYRVVLSIASCGYYLPSETPSNVSRGMRAATNKQLGLGPRTRVINGLHCRTLEVKDAARFRPYLDFVRREMKESKSSLPVTGKETYYSRAMLNDGSNGGIKVVSHPNKPLFAGDLEVRELGFRADYYPGIIADDETPDTYKYRKSLEQMRDDFGDVKEYMLRPAGNYIIIDFGFYKNPADIAVIDEMHPDGWSLFNNQVGIYGTSAFPETLLSVADNGHVYAFYKSFRSVAFMPKKGTDELPITLVTSNSAGVLGINGDSCVCVDLPPHADRIPSVSTAMYTWFFKNGYIDYTAKKQITWRPPTGNVYHAPKVRSANEVQLIKDWAYNFLYRYPEDMRAIYEAFSEAYSSLGICKRVREEDWKSIVEKLRISDFE